MLSKIYYATKGWKTFTFATLAFIAMVSDYISPEEATTLAEAIVFVISTIGVIWGRIDAER